MVALDVDSYADSHAVPQYHKFEEFARVSAAEVQWLSLALGEPIQFFQFLGVYLSRAQSYILLHGFKVRTHSKVNKQILTFYSKVNTFIG